MPLVTLIEDDQAIRHSLRNALEALGYAVRSASGAFEALQQVSEEAGDVIVLDLGLPDLDGVELLKMIRTLSPVPIIVATARDDDAEIVRSLDLGADDYVVKPFSATHLDARIRALLRRAGTPERTAVITVGELAIDPSQRQATLDGRKLGLTRKEFDLLHHLARRHGAVVTKRELLSEVWHQAFGGDDRTVDVHLSWLRRKLGETAARPRYLRVVRGVGAQLIDPDADPT